MPLLKAKAINANLIDKTSLFEKICFAFALKQPISVCF